MALALEFRRHASSDHTLPLVLAIAYIVVCALRPATLKWCGCLYSMGAYFYM